ncbi:MAG: carboxylesterase [Alphaproteobacteria bacterium]|nr:carboxylesterase [Alphaproteobacteria bacterium]
MRPPSLPTVEHVPAGPVKGCVIWLHGLGADGFDFAPLAPRLGLPGIRMVFPHAPIRPVTINAGYEMPSWYDIRSMDRVPERECAEDVVASAEIVEDLIAREVEAGTPASRIVLAGFSQGAAMTLYVGLRRREPLAGLLVLSGYLVLEDRLEHELGDRSVPLWFGHGTNDEVVAHASGRHAYERVRQLGLQAEWHEWSMGHEVCAEELRGLRAFLAARLP